MTLVAAHDLSSKCNIVLRCLCLTWYYCPFQQDNLVSATEGQRVIPVWYKICWKIQLFNKIVQFSRHDRIVNARVQLTSQRTYYAFPHPFRMPKMFFLHDRLAERSSVCEVIVTLQQSFSRILRNLPKYVIFQKILTSVVPAQNLCSKYYILLRCLGLAWCYGAFQLDDLLAAREGERLISVRNKVFWKIQLFIKIIQFFRHGHVVNASVQLNSKRKYCTFPHPCSMSKYYF